MASKLIDYFNKQPRMGIFCTASGDGKANGAVYGSPQMIDDKTVQVALGNFRTLANLKENPHAMYMIMESGESIMDWRGIRVYLDMKEVSTSGERLDMYKSEIAKTVGEDAANMISAVAIFEITEVRPLIDMGQGWEESI